MTPGLDAVLEEFSKRVAATPEGGLVLDAETYPPADAQDTLALFVHTRAFCRREGWAPPRPRASGDGAYVVQLAQTARGAVGWETGFKLVKVGAGWAFASNGQLCLFLDEAGQYTPRDARLGEGVAVQVPRVRENLVPLRLTLQGGAGGCEHAEPFVKLFVSATTVGARAVLEALAARSSESLAFSAYVCNEPKDYARADTVVVDVPRVFEAPVVRLLGEAARAAPEGLRPLVPLFARELTRGISRAEALGREDKADGFGLRRAAWLAESLLQALAVGEKSPAEWRARLPGALNRS